MVSPSFCVITPADHPHLITACWPQRPKNEIDDLFNRVYWLRQQQRGNGFVGRYDDGVVAFGMLTVWARRAEISDLIVDVQLRNRGIGTALIHFLTAEARKRCCDVLEIGVMSHNRAALRLYQRLGFCCTRMITLKSGDAPEKVFYLEKPLINNRLPLY